MVLKKIKNIITKEKSLTLLTKFLILASIFMVIVISLTLPVSQLQGMLREFSQVVLVISIGIGTIAITLSGDKTFRGKATREVLITLLIALLSYLLSYLESATIQRVYLILTGLYLLHLFLFVTVQIYSTNHSAETIQKKHSAKKSRKNKKRKKKRGYR